VEEFTRSCLEDVFKTNINSVGTHELWHIFKLPSRGLASSARFLYVTIEPRVIATCLYEVHACRSLIDNQLLKDEHFFIKDENILGFAVEVERPIMDLHSLIRIWNGPLS
jgi:hypothetical protein